MGSQGWETNSPTKGKKLMAVNRLQELEIENAQLRQQVQHWHAAFIAQRTECAELLSEYVSLVKTSRDDVKAAVEMAGGIYTQVAQTFIGPANLEPLPDDSQAPVEEDGSDWTDFVDLPGDDGGVVIAEPGELDGELDEGDVEPGDGWAGD